MDHNEWLQQDGVFVVEMTASAVTNMVENLFEMPKSFGQACQNAVHATELDQQDYYVVLKVKYEKSEMGNGGY